MQTGEVLEVHRSASSASRTGGRSAIKIVFACKSKTRDEREHRGFFWRFHGSKERILRLGESIKDGIAVEQICLTTGKLLTTFPSSRKASEKTGVNRPVIRRVLERRGVADGGGFFWRFQGDTRGPWPKPPPSRITAVEQLDLETGVVIREFPSLAEAKRALDLRPSSSCIRDTCNGTRRSAFGYFWRWKGSSILPKKTKRGKCVQLRKSKYGNVVRQFENVKSAADWIKMDFSAVCHWCREESRSEGYYWSYAPECSLTPDEKARVINKRIRVLRPKLDQWVEGKVISYDPTTEKHAILYDTGVTVRLRLEDVAHEFKNDQGQKPVEKLSLQTGEVLQTFKSVTEAAEDIGLRAPNSSRISAVLHGKSRQCGGFFYRYQGSNEVPSKQMNSKHPVEQLCLKTGRVLATFESIKAAGEAVGITTPGISYCCNGRNGCKNAGGFGWRFAKSDVSRNNLTSAIVEI